MQIINPLTLFLLLAIIAGFLALRKKRAGAVLLFASIGALWISSTPVFSSSLLSELERRYLPVPIAESPKADAIIVLGGCVGEIEDPRLEVDLTDASDRVLHGARLYHTGKAPFIIATGGANDRFGTKTQEALTIRKLLQEWDVPTKAIILETESLNTYQNAVNTKKLLDQRKLKTVLLVTSASHMHRALATFRSAGIHAIPSPTDYRVVNQEEFTILSFLPDAEALAGTTRAVKEYLGFLVYRWRGWIEK